MNKFILITSFAFLGLDAIAQQGVGINTTGGSPNSKSLLDIDVSGISGVKKGVLFPRMVWADRPTSLTASERGMLIFATDGDGTNGPGYYYYDGSAWQFFIPASDTYNFIKNNGGTTQSGARFKIDGNGIFNGGNVVIGSSTSVNGNKLDVWGTIGTRTGTHGTGRPLYVTGVNTAGSGGVEFRSDDGSKGIGVANNTIYSAGTDANQNINIKTSGTGNFAINTNNIDRVSVNGSNGETTIANLTGTGDRFVVTDAAGKLKEGASTATVPLTSGGAAGYPAIWTSASNIGFDTRYFFDGTNDRLGIGTNAPAQKVEIMGISNNDGGVMNMINLDRTKFMQFFGGHNADPNPFISTAASLPLRFGTSSNETSTGVFTEYARFKSDGNLGIGSANPGQKLDVNGVVNATNGFKVAGGTPSTSTYLKGNGTNFVAGTIVNADLPSGIGAAWQRSGTNVSLINNGDNVGVGTATPTDKLQVQGGITLDGAGANTGGLPNSLRFGTPASGEAIFSKRNAGGNVNGLDFLTNSTTRLSIANGGQVIINSLAGTGDRIVMVNSGGGTYATAALPVGDASYIQNQNSVDQTGNFRVTGNGTLNGNLSLGTNTVGASKLSIVGASAIQVDNGASFNGRNSGGTSEFFFTPRGGDNITYLNFGSAGMNIRNNGGVSRIFMQDGGNVGIGTTSPGATLNVQHVTGNTTPTKPTGSWAGLFENYQDDATSRHGLSVATRWGGVESKIFEAATYWNGASQTYTPILTVLGNRSVQITNAGTTAGTSTTYPLQIQRAGATDLTLGSDASVGYLQSWNSKPLIINSQGNNVGIGTTGIPNSPLMVRTSSSAANARTTSLANAIGDVLFELATSRGATTNNVGDITTQIGQAYNGGTISEGIRFFRGAGASDGQMAFLTNAGTERVRINAVGNVGIASSAPDNRLTVGASDGEGITIGRPNDAMGYDGGNNAIRFYGFRDVVTNAFSAKISAERTNVCCGWLSQGTDLAFYTNAGLTTSNADNSIERLRITDNGTVNIKRGVFFDCNDCGSSSALNGNADWGDLTIQGRVISTNSNMHLSPPGGSKVIINSAYRAAGGSAGTTGLQIEDGGIRMNKTIYFFQRFRYCNCYGAGAGTWDIGNYDFCAVGQAGFKNNQSNADEDDDIQCAVWPIDATGGGAPGEQTNYNATLTYNHASKPYWRMYAEAYEDSNGVTCAANCINFE